jgi:hypothetical protein
MLELPDDETGEGFSFLEPSLGRRRHAMVIGDEDTFLLRGVGEQDRVQRPFRKYVDGSSDIPPSANERIHELLADVIVGEEREPRH